MKRKVIISIIMCCILVIGIICCIRFMYYQEDNNTSDNISFANLGENEAYANLYWEFINSQEIQDRIKTQQLLYGVLDLDFNKIPDLFITDDVEFKEENWTYKNIEIYTIENNKVVKKSIQKIQPVYFGMTFNESKDRYYYTYERTTSEDKTKMGFNVFVTLDESDFITGMSESYVSRYSTTQIADSSNQTGLNNFMVIFNDYIETLSKTDLSNTYIIVADQNNEKSENNNASNNNNDRTQLLKNVVTIGDYVKFPNDDNEWRVLNVGDYVTLISAKGVRKIEAETGGGIYNMSVDINADEYYNNYVSIAHEIPTFESVMASYQKYNNGETADINSTLNGNLYNIGQPYYLPSGDCKGIDSPVIWVSENGKIMRTFYSLEAYTRPTLYLKEEVKTSGKDSSGKWLISD